MTTRENILPITKNKGNELVQGKVVEAGSHGIMVEASGRRLSAVPAFSCLVAPAADDLVLLSLTPENAYILSILERECANDMELRFPGDLYMNAENGKVFIRAETGMTCKTRGGMHFFSDSWIQKSSHGILDIDNLTARGTQVNLLFKQMRFIARIFETMAEHVLWRMKTYVRKSEETDQVDAGQMLRKTKGLFSMHSRTTVMTSTKETKIDGAHIHMG